MLRRLVQLVRRYAAKSWKNCCGRCCPTSFAHCSPLISPSSCTSCCGVAVKPGAAASPSC
eukprot:1161807-Pelagomonas_calceolata.AAC.1